MAARMNGRAAAVRGAVLLAVCVGFSGALGEDDFREELFVRPLRSGHVYSHFQFTTTWNVSFEDGMSHYNLFPKSLGQVVSKYSVQELHLSLTQGQWHAEKWGYPIAWSPPGAQLWVWFRPSTPNVDESWKGLINALSGLFCASLNFIDDTNTVKPKLSFKPSGLATDSYAKRTGYMRYATLPRENVCTENLTPWKKLLPCDSKAGLSTLFHAGSLYNANYHSLAVDLRPLCDDPPTCSRPALELSQSLGAVFDPSAGRQGRRDWTLRSLLGRPLNSACPMARHSKIYVDITDDKETNGWLLTPEYSVVSNNRGRSYAVYDVKSAARDRKLNIAMAWNESVEYSWGRPPYLHAHRFLSGYGQERGGITCQLFNNHPARPLRVVYMETVPWFVRLYLHTLEIVNNVQPIKPEKSLFTPGRDRSNPYLLEVVLTLPAQSVTTLSIQFDKAFLKWTEYPPDANIGFHISSAVVSVLMPSHDNITAVDHRNASLLVGLGDAEVADEDGGFFLRLYTEPLLVQLPVPDFSMPYNVICLTCTVVAIGFGSLHNLTTRQFVLRSASVPSLGQRLRGALAKLLGRSAPTTTSATTAENEETKTEDEDPGTEPKTDES